jgi:hypothetical protein
MGRGCKRRTKGNPADKGHRKNLTLRQHTVQIGQIDWYELYIGALRPQMLNAALEGTNPLVHPVWRDFRGLRTDAVSIAWRPKML